MPAYRNIRLCDKSCMCLYVCPTGATDTENSIIDVDKCIPGCMECVKACPSSAISMLPLAYPLQQPKKDEVIKTQRELGYSKLLQEKIADSVAAANTATANNAAGSTANTASTPVSRQFAAAISRSCRRMAEDILRESGYMLPQSKNVHELLEAMQESIKENPDPDFPKEALELLLSNLKLAV